MSFYNINSTSSINFKNVSYVNFEKNSDNTLFTFFWRYKSALKEERFEMSSTKFNELVGHLQEVGFKVVGEYLINLNNVLFIEDEPSTIVSRTKIIFTFVDGQVLRLDIANDFWNYWKGSI